MCMANSICFEVMELNRVWCDSNSLENLAVVVVVGGGGTLSQGHIKNLNKESRGQSVTSDLRPSNQSLMRPTTSHTDVLKNRADIISPINFPLLFFT